LALRSEKFSAFLQ